MYSIVMLAALTAAPETPNFHGLFGGHGHKTYSSCNGCTGYSCTGNTYSYSSCTGCTGTYSSCTGCTGHYSSCTGYSCSGYSSCHGGLFHGFFSHFHHKSYSSCSGCTGYSCSGCTGYSCHGTPTYYYQSSCTGCTGCTGFTYSSTYGPAYTIGGVTSPAPATTYPGVTTSVETPVSSAIGTRAQVIVKVPADAKLYADGHLTGLTGTDRTFMTPELSAGRDFQYTLKIEYTVNGEVQTSSKQIVVRAGEQTVVDLTAVAAVEKSSSPVTVNLPSNAKLFVDDQMASSTGGRMSFQTPALVKGQTYSYAFRAEVVKDGKTEVQTQKVVFKAGEPIRVDFSDMTADRTASAK